MKLCPECGANVEGLIHHCDCCGASLIPKKESIWRWVVYETGTDFHMYFNSIMEKIQTVEDDVLKKYFTEIFVCGYCHPDFLVAYLNLKENVRHSTGKKSADIDLLINYNQFVSARKEEKGVIVEDAILRGLETLESRLQKKKIYGVDILKKVRLALGRE